MSAPRAAARQILRPIQAFVATEAAGGALLLAAAVVALAWANSPWDGSYWDLWGARVRLSTDLLTVDEDLLHLVNDGLMAVFFFVVGLEIKREVLHGELASPRRAALPVVAAMGGMAVPALLYAGFNAGGEGSHGWGIPMATDIAFALGALAILGRRAPFGLKVFLLALAIVDDLGAIAVIALFYTEGLSLGALGWALLGFAATAVLVRGGVRSTPLFLALGVLTWLAVLKSGVHATVAGVALATLVPSRPQLPAGHFRTAVDGLLHRLAEARAAGDSEQAVAVLGEIEALSDRAEAPLDRLERALHPWVSFIVVPIFALANAGLTLSTDMVHDSLRSSVAGGVAVGLVLGKPVGILLFSWLAVRLGVAVLPPSLGFVHVVGAGLLGGIGFTVSLFVTQLAFTDAELVAEAKLAIFCASLVAGLAGLVWLRFAPGEPEAAEAQQPTAGHLGEHA
ncbi:MAG: Na+/H+ antiporter NhaA [Dehalococcoidia bacterium]|nr:Na+/H+ antiporter NhaA [Dehalococcoidia bacterium]